MAKNDLHDTVSVESTVLKNAAIILKATRSTVASLFSIFDDRVQERGRGAPSDEDIDLLRAALIFSGSGIDAVFKQVVKDALHVILQKSEPATTRLEEWTARRLTKESGASDSKFLAKLFVNGIFHTLSYELESDLTDHSLQSVEELCKLMSHLGIEDYKLDIPKLKSAFQVRNRIAHEMDADFAHPTRKRRTHKRADILEHCNVLLHLCNEVLKRLDEMISTGPWLSEIKGLQKARS